MPKAKPLPDLEILLDLFSYNSETGIIIYKKTRRGRVKQGAEAGAKRRLLCGNSTKLYIEVKVFGRICLAHRLAWYMHTGVDPVDYFIDHVDGNGYNNIFANLRLCTNQQNAFNRIAQTNNKSGFKGVYWQKKKQKWRAQIAFNYKKIHLGYFPTVELAHMAYCKAAAELHGDFARGA